MRDREKIKAREEIRKNSKNILSWIWIHIIKKDGHYWGDPDSVNLFRIIDEMARRFLS